jgi:hypothetical protein
MAKAGILRFAVCLVLQGVVAFSCAFPAVDKLGKACETSCEPYFCVNRVCQRNQETDSEPKDTTPPTSDREDVIRPLLSCDPILLDAGKTTVRLFRDCFDDRTMASGFNTPWPSGAGTPTLDPSTSVSTPNSVLFQQDAAVSSTMATLSLPETPTPFSEIFCSMRARFDGISTFTKVVQFRASEMTGRGEEVSISVYPVGGELRWRMYRVFADGGSLLEDVPMGSDGREWLPLTILLTRTQVRVQIGNSRHQALVGTSTPMLGVGLGLGIYASDDAPRTLRFDDVSCEGVPE